jgi:Rod binding domain-containing protein
MGIMKKLGKSGMFGLAGLAATNPKITNKIARSGGLGLAGMMLAKKNKKAAEAAGGMRGRPMMEDIMVAEEVPAGATMRKGGKVKNSDIKQDKAMIASAVHKHERAKHKGQPLTKMAKGGSTASKRADGCATKGKTKGRFV